MFSEMFFSIACRILDQMSSPAFGQTEYSAPLAFLSVAYPALCLSKGCEQKNHMWAESAFDHRDWMTETERLWS